MCCHSVELIAQFIVISEHTQFIVFSGITYFTPVGPSNGAPYCLQLGRGGPFRLHGIFNLVYILFLYITYFILFADITYFILFTDITSFVVFAELVSLRCHYHFFGLQFIPLTHSCKLDNITQLKFCTWYYFQPCPTPWSSTTSCAVDPLISYLSLQSSQTFPICILVENLGASSWRT